MESLNKTDVSVRSCSCISLTEALQRSRAPNFARIQIMTMDKKTNSEIKERVNGQIYPSSDCLGYGSTII
jgi:hypothetical protein